ncbi:hypothetical protein HNQ10_003781 [Deinococcus metallilatus]|uniref:Lipocalin-like domain-containing protein n=1 Tax=Deinococcus metallilatus TaxID=1211322 RepID=A0ABR6N095_9DEIO|nr:hypothetical protein [Deinococcus metallilatus]GMA15183.1 hypothetical protein GCM10025871_15140 [Deinococcus metallilatus]
MSKVAGFIVMCSILLFTTSCKDASDYASLNDLYGVWSTKGNEREQIVLTLNRDNSYSWKSHDKIDGTSFYANGKFKYEKDLKYVMLQDFYSNGDFVRLAVISVLSKKSSLRLMRNEDQLLEKIE